MNRAGYEGLRRGPPRPATVHRVALGLGRHAALGLELDGRRGQYLGLDAPADGHRDRPGPVGRALLGSGHRRLQRRAPRRALPALAADERAACPTAAPTRCWVRRRASPGASTSPTRGIIVAWLRLRYRLLPYLYTLAHEATATRSAPRPSPVVAGARRRRPRRPSSPATDASVGDGRCRRRFPSRRRPAGGAGDRSRDSDGARSAPRPLPAGARWRQPVGWLTGLGGGTGGSGGLDSMHPPGASLSSSVPVRSSPLDDGWTGRRRPLPGRRRRRPRPRPPRRRDGGRLGLDHAPRRLAFHCWPTDSGRCPRDRASTTPETATARCDVTRLRLAGAVAGRIGRRDVGAPWRLPAARLVVRVVLHGFAAEQRHRRRPTGGGDGLVGRVPPVLRAPSGRAADRFEEVAPLILRKSGPARSFPRRGSTSPATCCAG